MVPEKREKKSSKLKLTDQPLFRVGVVLVVVLAAFVLVRGVFVPESFGAYGYYRGDSVSELASQTAQYTSGAQNCQACHQDKAADWSRGEHAAINCESCHGPAAQHVSDPGRVKPVVRQDREFCAACHDRLPSRPETIRQVDVRTHNTGSNCTSCHNPHKPGMGG